MTPLSKELYKIYLSNFSAPKLKGRPRKRRKLKEGGGNPNSPEDGSELESNSSEGSNATVLNNKVRAM